MQRSPPIPGCNRTVVRGQEWGGRPGTRAGGSFGWTRVDVCWYAPARMTSGKAGLKVLGRRSALRIALMLAMSLLCAQWAAQAHAYTHRSPETVAKNQVELKVRLCSDCLSFAPLLSAAAGSSLPPVPAPQGVDPAPAGVACSLVSRGFPAAFRSRAPPYSR